MPPCPTMPRRPTQPKPSPSFQPSHGAPFRVAVATATAVALCSCSGDVAMGYMPALQRHTCFAAAALTLTAHGTHNHTIDVCL